VISTKDLCAVNKICNVTVTKIFCEMFYTLRSSW